MNPRLPAELDRLYGSRTSVPEARRAAVLELRLPAGWDALGAVWRGVQTDLELPAPAIAVSGADALQLWFAFASPASPAARAQFLRGLCGRYLAGLTSAPLSAQLRLHVDAIGFPPLPPVMTGPQRWSAFVTPDLASVFGETPWLDIPPGDDAQATILQSLRPMSPAQVEAALRALAAPGSVASQPTPAAPVSSPPPMPAAPPADSDPARFLTRVMNDESAPLALRVEAAKALLQQRDPRD